MLLRLIVALLGVTLSAGVVEAQSATTNAQRNLTAHAKTDGAIRDRNSHGGAFDKLAPGNQKIARALVAVQMTNGEPTAATLTLDDIAAMKREGQGWGEIIHQMQEQGFIQEKSLNQVARILRHHHKWRPPRRLQTRPDGVAPATSTASNPRGRSLYRSTGPLITSGSGRTYFGRWSTMGNGVTVTPGRGSPVISPRSGSHGPGPGNGVIGGSRRRHSTVGPVSRGHGDGKPE